MSLFGASRFTAMLATIAVLGTVGSLSWIVVNHLHLKTGATGKSASRASRQKNERSKFVSFRTNERPQPIASGWGDERDQLRKPRAFADVTTPSLQDRGADMPLPVPPITWSNLNTGQAKSAEPVVFAPQSMESQKRLTGDPRPEP